MSISFDRIATRYDTTRGFPPGVDAQIGAAFRRQSGLPGGARLLEIGVGTGRIAIPLASQGYHYIGVDISAKMMWRLRERLPQDTAVSLLRGDATALPLRDASVDGAVTVHVFHLVAGWELALAELQRVIRPGGTLAVGFNDVGEPPPAERLRERWRAIVHELGGDTRRPGATKEQLDPLLETLFGPPRRAVLATWQRRESLRERLDMIAARTHSDAWGVPEPILQSRSGASRNGRTTPMATWKARTRSRRISRCCSIRSAKRDGGRRQSWRRGDIRGGDTRRRSAYKIHNRALQCMTCWGDRVRRV